MKLDEIAAVVFIDIAIIIVVARFMGALFKRFRQPPVVGEIVGGIVLGPSLLGLFPGHLGLQSMRERASQLGGALEIESAIGTGTSITIRMPVVADKALTPTASS